MIAVRKFYRDPKIQGVPKKCIHTISICYKNLLYRANKNNFEMPSFTLERWCTSPFHRDVKTYLNKDIQNKWFGRRGTIRYLPSLPDFTPVNFFV